MKELTDFLEVELNKLDGGADNKLIIRLANIIKAQDETIESSAEAKTLNAFINNVIKLNGRIKEIINDTRRTC